MIAVATTAGIDQCAAHGGCVRVRVREEAALGAAFLCMKVSPAIGRAVMTGDASLDRRLDGPLNAPARAGRRPDFRDETGHEKPLDGSKPI
ncbi:hypothetical protein [Burkholderia puraquae]|uniref:hypothetical protein n=1 Tax=Burkholderia puraquae TaxID=1904757 RepID=UPI0010557949|nr:hypothetical protein [Burkholderia puraquae]